MILISLVFCFFDNKKIDILRTGEEDFDAKKFLANLKSPAERTDRSHKEEKMEKAYSILE